MTNKMESKTSNFPVPGMQAVPLKIRVVESPAGKLLIFH